MAWSFRPTQTWWAMAIRGQAAGVADKKGNRCFTARDSQSASLIRVYEPTKFFHCSSSNDFFVCGPNYNDARLYIRYLLW
jgi:hypothetical protein